MVGSTKAGTRLSLAVDGGLDELVTECGWLFMESYASLHWVGQAIECSIQLRISPDGKLFND